MHQQRAALLHEFLAVLKEQHLHVIADGFGETGGGDADEGGVVLFGYVF